MKESSIPKFTQDEDSEGVTILMDGKPISPEEIIDLLNNGQRISTGLIDSNGILIHIGDRVKKATECNQELHGKWVEMQVIQRGIVPVLSYMKSEKGKVLTEGYTAAPLSDHYDGKLFCFASNISELKPYYDIEVIQPECTENTQND